MEPNYSTDNITTFFRLIILIIIVAPCAYFLMMISQDTTLLIYFPITILYTLMVTFIILNTNDFNKFKRNIINNQTVPYYTFIYDKDEWNSFVRKGLKSSKKSLRKLTLILLPITVLLYLIGTLNPGISISIFFGLATLHINISIALVLYLTKIKPLTEQINSKLREITFYDEGYAIVHNKYVLNFYGNKKHTYLDNISLENMDKINYLCFNTALVIYEVNHDHDIIKKNLIPIPIKKQHLASEILLLFTEKLR